MGATFVRSLLFENVLAAVVSGVRERAERIAGYYLFGLLIKYPAWYWP